MGITKPSPTCLCHLYWQSPVCQSLDPSRVSWLRCFSRSLQVSARVEEWGMRVACGAAGSRAPDGCCYHCCWSAAVRLGHLYGRTWCWPLLGIQHVEKHGRTQVKSPHVTAVSPGRVAINGNQQVSCGWNSLSAGFPSPPKADELRAPSPPNDEGLVKGSKGRHTTLPCIQMVFSSCFYSPTEKSRHT